MFGGQETSTTIKLQACPACGAEFQAKSAVFECVRCHGMWVPPNALMPLLERADQEVAELLGDFPAGDATFQKSSSPRCCACCGQKMTNYQFAEKSGIWIDCCPAGHGIWLDAGEFRLVHRFHNKGAAQTDIDVDDIDPYRAAFLKSLKDAVEE